MPPKSTRLRLWGFTAVLLVRAAVFPFAKNFYGDPAVRLKALTAWLAHPFFLRSFVGAHQFGILHLYLLALGQWIHADLDVGPKLISLLFGSLSALPLFSLTERRFGSLAALISTLGLAIYPLHIQTSTTATSEAVFLFFLLAALDQLDRATEGRRGPLIAAGALMACACAVRYDGWIYGPLSALWLWQPLREKRLSWGFAALYAAEVGAVPLLLCIGNWLDLGDPLYVLHYIAENHVQMAQLAAQSMGRWSYALYAMLFWPANLAWELTPPIAIGVAFGGFLACQARKQIDLLLLAAIPAILFSLEGTMLRFHPLARFTIPTAVLLLPYAGNGLLALGQRIPGRLRPALALASIAAGLALPTYLAWRTIGHDDWYADTLRPISPISNLPPELDDTAAWLRSNAAGKRVEIETNWLYEELPIELYGGAQGAQLFTPLEAKRPPGFVPDLVVLPKEADVLRDGNAELKGKVLRLSDERFDAVASIGKVTIFARRPSSG